MKPSEKDKNLTLVELLKTHTLMRALQVDIDICFLKLHKPKRLGNTALVADFYQTSYASKTNLRCVHYGSHLEEMLCFMEIVLVSQFIINRCSS